MKTTAGTFAPKVDDLRVKNIPSGLINPVLCLIMQMVGQEFVINVDPSCQVSTVRARGCGETMWMFPLLKTICMKLTFFRHSCDWSAFVRLKFIPVLLFFFCNAHYSSFGMRGNRASAALVDHQKSVANVWCYQISVVYFQCFGEIISQQIQAALVICI